MTFYNDKITKLIKRINIIIISAALIAVALLLNSAGVAYYKKRNARL